MSTLSTTNVGNDVAMSTKPTRPTIHVQLDVKNPDPDEGGGGGNPSAGDNPPPFLRVSFSGTKRSELSLFRASRLQSNQTFFVRELRIFVIS